MSSEDEIKQKQLITVPLFRSAKSKLFSSTLDGSAVCLTGEEAQALYAVVADMELMGVGVVFSRAFDTKVFEKLNLESRTNYVHSIQERDYLISQKKHRETMYNHFFEIPLTPNQNFELESIRTVIFNLIPKERFIKELQKSQYWSKFKDFKLKENNIID